MIHTAEGFSIWDKNVPAKKCDYHTKSVTALRRIEMLLPSYGNHIKDLEYCKNMHTQEHTTIPGLAAPPLNRPHPSTEHEPAGYNLMCYFYSSMEIQGTLCDVCMLDSYNDIKNNDQLTHCSHSCLDSTKRARHHYEASNRCQSSHRLVMTLLNQICKTMESYNCKLSYNWLAGM